MVDTWFVICVAASKVARSHAEASDWYFDQRLMSTALDVWREFPFSAELIPRKPKRDRTDRLNWLFTPHGDKRDVGGLVDAHLLMPGDHPNNWPNVRALLSALFQDADVMSRIDDYKEAFSKVAGKPGDTDPTLIPGVKVHLPD
eukprot:CAMPEP_0175873742 /NCGR_PEP_ID=MMETSP0107_2-20121207/38488_1 /TAXON_ID=195067 ORGANISM="Goniomonas pacifica, Strain CCMP1869" /NCGR_SAMPLE_ID=MMETSP0107_2 /ASSEMBLY_ACC=CAM_ASM_000203 /LENGTH=143 /DNA_ID=CAMNT_0017192523 /DNA_START=43 /DNA_END=474 /DNA_ORIENTATION=+